MSDLVERLRQLSRAAADGQWREFSMRVPAEPERDADLVLARAADEIASLRADAERYRWMRNRPDWIVYEHDVGPEDIDAAIDSAIDAARNATK